MKRLVFAIIISTAAAGFAFAGSISGTVLNDSASPVEGVMVDAFDYYTDIRVGHARTEPDGTYLIGGLDEGVYRLHLWNLDQYYVADKQYLDVPLNVGQNENVTGIDFTLGFGVTISGTVTTPWGSAVADASVSCFSDQGYLSPVNTQVDGTYLIEGISPGQMCRVAAVPPDDGNDLMMSYVEQYVGTGGVSGVDIQFDNNGRTVSGFVTDKATGQPLEGIFVNSWLQNYEVGGDIDFTDQYGYYEIIGLPQTVVEIAVHSDDHARFGRQFDLSNDKTLNFIMPLPSSISGIVIDEDSGEPVEGIQVKYWNEVSQVWDNFVTSRSGRFMLGKLPPGLCELYAQPDFDSGYMMFVSEPDLNFNVPEGVDLAGRFIAIKKGTPAVGRLVNPDLTPVVNAGFEFAANWTESWNNTTDANGQFEVLMPDGTNHLSIEIYDDTYSPHNDTVVVTDQPSPFYLGDIVMYNQSSTGQISGRISNPGSSPCQGELFALAIPSGMTLNTDNFTPFRPSSMAFPDATDSYTLAGLVPGHYDVLLLSMKSSADEVEMVRRDLAANVAFDANGVDLEYLSEGGSITGRLEDTYGRAVGPVTMLLNESGSGLFSGFTNTAPDGTFTFENVEPGSHTLSLVHRTYASSTALEVYEGQVTDIGVITIGFAGFSQGADTDGNGEVAIEDLQVLADNWLAPGGTNIDDLVRLSRLWLMKAAWRN